MTSKQKKIVIPTLQDLQLKKIKMKIEMQMLDMILAFLYKDTKLRTRKTLNNTYKLFNMIEESIYDETPDLNSRFWLIKKTLEARIIHEFENDSMIKQFCKEDADSTPLTDSIIDNIQNIKITYDEVKYIIKSIDDRLNFGYVITLKQIHRELLDMIDEDDYRSFKTISEDLYEMATTIVNVKRATKSLESEITFSLRQEMFENVIADSMQKLQDKNKVFITGIKRLNTILSPGYHSKRLYTYLAFPGGGKSQVLLKAALDIKKYNAGITPKDPDKTPAVLLITMENDIDETVERLFNMAVTNDDIRNYTVKQVIRKLKEDGSMSLTDKDNIDIIIKYYPNRSIDTDDLYGIIKDLEDSGTEVIALILDYIKRIRPSTKSANEKEELKNISNELKTLARQLDITVITAQQLNRTASSVIDAAIQNKKEDVTRLIGRDGVGGAWEIIENSDVVIIINQEVKQDTGELYLTFKMLKRRYRSSEEDEQLRRMDYFNHPYESGNTIKLVDDLYAPQSVSLISLSSQFSPSPSRGNRSAVEREEFNPNDQLEFEPFDIKKTFN